METKKGAIADLHYLDFSENSKNTNNIKDNTILSTIDKTGNNVIKFLWKKINTESSVENPTSMVASNKKALEKQIIHRFSISQWWINMVISIWLSVEEIESSELSTLEDVAREKFTRRILNNEIEDENINNEFNIWEEINFRLLWIETEHWFRPEKWAILKEM